MSTKGAGKAYYLFVAVCITASLAVACSGDISTVDRSVNRERSPDYSEALTRKQVENMEEGPLKDIYIFAEQFNVYFWNATTAWLLKKDDSALLAAFGAAQTAERLQRQSMADALNGLSDEFERHPEEINAELAPFGIGAQEAKDKLKWLASEITKRDWSILESIETRKMLDNVDPGYSYALDVADARVFCARYPEISEMLICDE